MLRGWKTSVSLSPFVQWTKTPWLSTWLLYIHTNHLSFTCLVFIHTHKSPVLYLPGCYTYTHITCPLLAWLCICVHKSPVVYLPGYIYTNHLSFICLVVIYTHKSPVLYLPGYTYTQITCPLLAWLLYIHTNHLSFTCLVVIHTHKSPILHWQKSVKRYIRCQKLSAWIVLQKIKRTRIAWC